MRTIARIKYDQRLAMCKLFGSCEALIDCGSLTNPVTVSIVEELRQLSDELKAAWERRDHAESV